MAALLPMSVAPRPPELNPPTCAVGSTRTAVLPRRAACTTAATPAAVPPYTQTSTVVVGGAVHRAEWMELTRRHRLSNAEAIFMCGCHLFCRHKPPFASEITTR